MPRPYFDTNVLYFHALHESQLIRIETVDHMLLQLGWVPDSNTPGNWVNLRTDCSFPARVAYVAVLLKQFAIQFSHVKN